MKDRRYAALRKRFGNVDVGRQSLVDELRSAPDAAELLAALMRDQRQDIRVRAVSISRDVLSREAAPLLIDVSQSDRDEDVRSVAREVLLDIDPQALVQVMPHMLKDLAVASDPFGDARQSMLTIARAHYTPAVPALRAFSDRFPPKSYGHEMPLVLIDYINDPSEIRRRINEHDHDHMYWLVEAAAVLQPAGAVDAVRECAEQPQDGVCGSICSKAMRRIALRESRE